MGDLRSCRSTAREQSSSCPSVHSVLLKDTSEKHVSVRSQTYNEFWLAGSNNNSLCLEQEASWTTCSVMLTSKVCLVMRRCQLIRLRFVSWTNSSPLSGLILLTGDVVYVYWEMYWVSSPVLLASSIFTYLHLASSCSGKIFPGFQPWVLWHNCGLAHKAGGTAWGKYRRLSSFVELEIFREYPRVRGNSVKISKLQSSSNALDAGESTCQCPESVRDQFYLFLLFLTWIFSFVRISFEAWTAKTKYGAVHRISKCLQALQAPSKCNVSSIEPFCSAARGHACRSIEPAPICLSLPQIPPASCCWTWSDGLWCLPLSGGRTVLGTKLEIACERIMGHLWKCRLAWFQRDCGIVWNSKMIFRVPIALAFRIWGEEIWRRRYFREAGYVSTFDKHFLPQATHMGWQIISAEHPLKMSGLLFYRHACCREKSICHALPIFALQEFLHLEAILSLRSES